MTLGLRPQPRDLTVFSEIGETGVLDTITLHARHWPNDRSGRSARRRLLLYARHGLTQQVQLSLATTQRTGRLPTLHRLTSKGADLVEHETGDRPIRLAHSEPPSPHTLLHRLGIAKLQLVTNDACGNAGLSKPQWILEYDPVPGVAMHEPLARRFRLRHDFPSGNGRKSTCWPDAAALLSIPSNGETWQLGLFFEFDRSTESLSQVAAKMPGYEALLASAAASELWPTVRAIRVLFVVPSVERLHNIATAIRHSSIAQYVRLAVTNDLTPDRLLADAIWSTVVGERRSILLPAKDSHA